MSQNTIPFIQRFSAILWPSFLIAGMANALLFAIFDPDVVLIGYDLSRLAAYSIGFFILWLITALSSLSTLYFLQPCVPRQKVSGD